MTQDEIVEMARQAGLDPDLWNYTDAFETFAKLVAAKESKEAWEAVNALIALGHIGGNGTDLTAQRNGLVMASNVLMRRITGDKHD